MSKFGNYIKRRILKYIKSIDNIKDNTSIKEYMEILNNLKHE